MKFSIFADLHHLPGVFMGINREHTENPIYDKAGRPVVPVV